MSEPGYTEPAPELERRSLDAGEARVAVMRRTYRAPIEDVWDACTTPDRLARWYVPVSIWTRRWRRRCSAARPRWRRCSSQTGSADLLV